MLEPSKLRCSLRAHLSCVLLELLAMLKVKVSSWASSKPLPSERELFTCGHSLPGLCRAESREGRKEGKRKERKGKLKGAQWDASHSNSGGFVVVAFIAVLLKRSEPWIRFAMAPIWTARVGKKGSLSSLSLSLQVYLSEYHWNTKQVCYNNCCFCCRSNNNNNNQVCCYFLLQYDYPSMLKCSKCEKARIKAKRLKLDRLLASLISSFSILSRSQSQSRSQSKTQSQCLFTGHADGDACDVNKYRVVATFAKQPSTTILKALTWAPAPALTSAPALTRASTSASADLLASSRYQLLELEASKE